MRRTCRPSQPKFDQHESSLDAGRQAERYLLRATLRRIGSGGPARPRIRSDGRPEFRFAMGLHAPDLGEHWCHGPGGTPKLDRDPQMCFLAGPPPLILVPAESQCSTSVAPVRYQQSANAAPEGYKCGTSAVPAQQQRRTKAESVQFHRGASAVLLQERSSISATSV